jgi:hypothetical protein
MERFLSMEQEIHTRQLFTGAFSFGTFLWFSLIFHAPVMRAFEGKAGSGWVAILIALVFTIPFMGFIADSIRHHFRNYDKDVFYPYTSDYVRTVIKRNFNKLLEKKSIGIAEKVILRKEVLNMQPDALYSLIARGGWSDDIQMPQSVSDNARRRWTVVWASWNCQTGITLGLLAFLLYEWYVYLIEKDVFGLWQLSMPEFIAGALLALIPIGVFFFFEYTGRRARDRVVSLEKAWALSAGLPLALKKSTFPFVANIFYLPISDLFRLVLHRLRSSDQNVSPEKERQEKRDSTNRF